VVAVLSFSDAGRVDAFSTAAGDRPTVVLTADKSSALRTRFTTAHELAHLLLHADVIPGDIRHEREADAFAAEFLMPAAVITAELPTRVDLPALLGLQQRWGVSVPALLHRCRELGTLSEAFLQTGHDAGIPARLAHSRARREPADRTPGPAAPGLRPRHQPGRDHRNPG
jgi:Zn-dependent peptidase ImmA (M78 family)